MNGEWDGKGERRFVCKGRIGGRPSDLQFIVCKGIPCFNGIEQQVVSKIAEWITRDKGAK
jgi:hypothetical protein